MQVTYSPDLGDVQEYFLGSGGLINLYGSLTGESMPGLTEAVAQVNVCLIRCRGRDLNGVLVLQNCLGSGGLINLYGSLTGESMPCLTEAVAQASPLRE